MHDHERKAPQRVRVNISATLRALPASDSLAHTYDYMQMVAAIDDVAIVHFDLLENIAAALAEKILSDARLSEIKIILTKLDILENGHVGVRYRASR